MKVACYKGFSVLGALQCNTDVTKNVLQCNIDIDIDKEIDIDIDIELDIEIEIERNSCGSLPL